jgi:hypothetical protein
MSAPVVVLPESGTANVLASLSAQNERRQEFDYNKRMQEQQRQEQRQASNRMTNLHNIDDATDFKQYQTGEQAFDNFSINKLQELQKQFMGMTDADPVELEYRIQQTMKPFLTWHQQGKGAIATMKKGLQDFNKTYPNVDLPTAENLMSKQMFNDFFETDENGQPKMKNPSFIPQRDYTSVLQDPNVLGQIVNDTKPFYDAFQNIKTSPVGEKDYKNKKGKVVSYKWSGAETPFTKRVTDDEGKVTGIETNYTPFEAVQDGKKQPMRLATDEMMTYLHSNPQSYAGMVGAWNKFKQQKGLSNLSPAEEDILLRNFVYNTAEQYMPKGFKTEEITKEPKITNNIYNKTGEPQIRDVYAEINTKADDPARPHKTIPLNELSASAQAIVLRYTNDLTKADLGQKDIFLKKEPDGTINIVRSKNGAVIAPIDAVDINIKAQVGAKEKREILKNSGSKKPSKKNTLIPPVPMT